MYRSIADIHIMFFQWNKRIICECTDINLHHVCLCESDLWLGLAKELFFNALFFQIQDIVHTFWAQGRIQLVSTFPILSRVCGGCVICDHSSTLLPKWTKRDKYPLSSSAIEVWNTKTTGWTKVKYCWEQIWRGRVSSSSSSSANDGKDSWSDSSSKRTAWFGW